MRISDFTFTRHALDRILDMQVDAETVRGALLGPEYVHPSPSYPHTDLYDYQDITLSVDRAMREVITVLWRWQEGWEADLARGEYHHRAADAGKNLRRKTSSV